MQVAVNGLAADAELAGQGGLAFADVGVLAQLIRLGLGEGGLAPGGETSAWSGIVRSIIVL